MDLPLITKFMKISIDVFSSNRCCLAKVMRVLSMIFDNRAKFQGRGTPQSIPNIDTHLTI